MRIISFAWTTPALLAGRKTCTRRDWDESYALSFKAGDLVAAYDRSPRAHGHQVATIRLTQAPTLEALRDAPEEDYEREGFAWMYEQGLKVDGFSPLQLWREWRVSRDKQWVVRFRLVEITKGENENR